MNNSSIPKINHIELLKRSQIIRKLSTVKERDDETIA